MPVCPHCQTKWSWSQSCKAFYKMKHWSVHCPHCGEKLYLDYGDQDKVMFLRILVLPLLLISLFNDQLIDPFSIATFLYILAVPMLLPFLIKFTPE